MQEIITYLIVAAAVTAALYKFYSSVFARKKTSGACGDCSCSKENCASTSQLQS